VTLLDPVPFVSFVVRCAEATWTVASLATTVGMSRSAFAARFTQLVGEPAMHYATRWKMHAALMWLKENDASLAELGSRLGYESEAAFSRAFKRVIGVSPGALRRLDAPKAANLTGTATGHMAHVQRQGSDSRPRYDACPMMYDDGVDLGHTCMRWILRLTGGVPT
jgi:AraC-like DNA-binding protein